MNLSPGNSHKDYSPAYDQKRLFLPTLMILSNDFGENETEGDTLWNEITGSMRI